jgi:TIR domain
LGKMWHKILSEELDACRCFVVVWSKHSVDSEWVLEEAGLAKRKGLAIAPILLDAVDPPFGYQLIQAADLSAWDGSPSSPLFQNLAREIKKILGPPSAPEHKHHEPEPAKIKSPEPEPDELTPAQAEISKSTAEEPSLTESTLEEAPAHELKSIELKFAKPTPSESEYNEQKPVEIWKTIEQIRGSRVFFIGVSAGLALLILIVGLWWFRPERPNNQAMSPDVSPLIHDLFSKDKRVRTGAYENLIKNKGWENDPNVLQYLIKFANQNMENLNGIFNTVVVLNEFKEDAFKANKNKQEVLGFLEKASVGNPNIAAKAIPLQKKLGN